MRDAVDDIAVLDAPLQPPADRHDKESVWWCITCSLVASILVPLAINALLYLLAVAICRALHLPKDTRTLMLCVLKCGHCVLFSFLRSMPLCERRR